MAEEVQLEKLSGERRPTEIKWNAVEAESDVIIRICSSHVVVLKDRLGASEVKYYERDGSIFVCYRLR